MIEKIKQLAKETSMTERDIARSLQSQAESGHPLKLNLQYFADPEEPVDDSGDDDPKGDPEDKKTFTKSEVDSQISKAVDSALKKRESKHQEELQKAIDDAIAEKERLSKLSEKERKEEEMTQREKELADKEAEIARKVLRSEAVDDLQKKQLPSEFADFLLGKDAEQTLNNINEFKKAFDAAVNSAVKDKLRQDTPPAGGGSLSNKQPSVAELAKEHRIIK